MKTTLQAFNATTPNILKLVYLPFIILLLVGAAVVLWLAIPISPTAGRALYYRGYTLLPGDPKRHLIRILDYLTVSGSDLFVADQSSGTAYKLALADIGRPAQVAGFATGAAPHGVAIDPNGRLAFLSRSEANTVEVFDPVTMTSKSTIPVPDDPDGIVFLPFARLIYVVSGDAGRATLIDPEKSVVVGSIALGGKPEFMAVDEGRGRVFQNLVDQNGVAVVDIAARAVDRMLPIAGCKEPHGLAFDEEHRRLFVGCGGNSRLVVLDADRGLVVTSLAVGGGRTRWPTIPDSTASTSPENQAWFQ